MTRNDTNAKPRCELMTNPAKRRVASELADSVKDSLPQGLSQPALRALAAAGYTRLDQLSEVSEPDLRKRHGMGPKAIEIIRSALRQNGKSFRHSATG